MPGFKITQPQPLSKPFQAFMGRPSATRSDVYSAICAYIRENDLRQGKEVIYDDELQKLLGVKSLKKSTALMDQISKAGAFTPMASQRLASGVQD